MKAAKWREMSDEEVQQKARELGEELFNLRFQLSMGVAKNPSRVGQARRGWLSANRDTALRFLKDLLVRTDRPDPRSRP